MEKYSVGYRLLCRFFKECGIYHDFIKYQREGEKYVSFRCRKVPVTSDNIVADFGNTCFTSWMEVIHRQRFKTFYELFKAWLYFYYPKLNIDKNCISFEYRKIIIDAKKNGEKLKLKLFK